MRRDRYPFTRRSADCLPNAREMRSIGSLQDQLSFLHDSGQTRSNKGCALGRGSKQSGSGIILPPDLDRQAVALVEEKQADSVLTQEGVGRLHYVPAEIGSV